MAGAKVSIAEAEAAKEKGIAKAAAGAGEEWLADALDFFVIFATENKEVQMDDVRKFAYENGMDAARDDRWWGPIGRRAEKSGIVKWAKPGKAKNKQAHRRPNNVWKSKIYAN